MDDPRLQMMQMAVGYWPARALYCAARAGVADALAEGPRPVSELAAEAGVDEENLHRVLRALASMGVFAETEPRTYGLTPAAEFLKTDHPQTMRNFAMMVNDDLYEAWCDLYHTVETGEAAFKKRFGTDAFTYLAKEPEKVQVFDRAMQEIHGVETQLMVEGFDFSRFSTVLDVGGGNGTTLAGILGANPSLRGQLFELPPVVEGARGVIGEAGLADRVDFIPGDFFKEVPGDADCVVMRHVLHDWSDADSKTILENSVKGLAAGGSVLVVEKVITPGNDPDFTKLLDLNMMAIGGKERTEAQYRELFASAGLTLHAVHVLPGPTDIVEARLA